MISVSMRDIDRIYTLHFLGIELDFDWSLHQISDSIVREPAIYEDTYIVSVRIRYIDEELGMSEGGDDHIL